MNYLPKSFLGGNHNLKAGYQFYWEQRRHGVAEHGQRDYLLTFDRVNGLSHQPAEITTYNDPIISPVNKEMQYAGYVQDNWALGRATVNLGLRIGSLPHLRGRADEGAGRVRQLAGRSRSSTC